MATLSTVSVDFVANTAKYTQGLTAMQKQTKAWSAGIKKDTQAATDAFDGVSKALTRFATQAISIAAIQKIGAAFMQAAKEVSMLADEAEKVGASAEQFAKLDLAAKKNGASISDVKVAYKELQKSTNEALAGNKETVQSFKDLGVSYNYIAGLSPDKKFLAVADALSQVADENKRAEIGVRLLGKSYTELAPLIAKGAFGINVAGAGALSEKDVQTIDKVTKAFEGLAKSVDNEFKKAIVDLAPALMAIADIAKVILNNWGSILVFFAALSPKIQGWAGAIIKFIGQAFSPVYFSEFAAAGTPILAAFFANIADKFAAIAEIGILRFGALGNALTVFGSIGQTVFNGLTASVVSLSAAFSSFGIGVVIIGGTLAASFMAGLVAMEGLMNGIAKGLELFNKESAMAKDFRATAAAYEKTREDIVAKIFSIDRTGETPEILAQRMQIAQYKIERDAKKAGEALDAETERINKLKEEGKKLLEELTSFGANTKKDVMTPYEKAKEQFTNLVNALDLGTISLQDYDRAMEKLRNTIDDVDLAKLRAIFGEGPRGGLGKYGAPSLAAEMSAAQVGARAEMFGIGTIVGGKLPKELENIKTPFEQLQEQLKSTGISLLENGRTAKEVYDSEVQAINAAVEAYKLQGREQDALRLQTIALLESSNKLRDANIEAFARANPYIIQAFNYMSDFADQFSRAIAEGQNFGDALKNVFKSILREITALIIKTTILQGIMAAIGIISPNTGAAAAFGKMTGLIPRAKGGPVMAGEGYRVGEAGPETFVPSTNGYILPNDMASGETVIVNQTINVQTGVAQTVKAEMFSLLPRFKQEAMAGVLDAKQRGGSYSKLLTA